MDYCWVRQFLRGFDLRGIALLDWFLVALSHVRVGGRRQTEYQYLAQSQGSVR